MLSGKLIYGEFDWYEILWSGANSATLNWSTLELEVEGSERHLVSGHYGTYCLKINLSLEWREPGFLKTGGDIL